MPVKRRVADGAADRPGLHLHQLPAPLRLALRVVLDHRQRGQPGRVVELLRLGRSGSAAFLALAGLAGAGRGGAGATAWPSGSGIRSCGFRCGSGWRVHGARPRPAPAPWPCGGRGTPAGRAGPPCRRPWRSARPWSRTARAAAAAGRRRSGRPGPSGGMAASTSASCRSARISFHIATARAVTSFSSAASTGP